MLNFHQRKWNANLTTSYTDNRSTLTEGASNTELVLDDYWQINGKLTYNLLADFQVFLQAKNILDDTYQTPTSSNTINHGTAIVKEKYWQAFRIDFNC